MFGNLNLYVAQEHTMAAFKGIHPGSNSPFSNMQQTNNNNNNMLDPTYHQLSPYSSYLPKEKFQQHAYEGHRAHYFPAFHLSFPQRIPSPNRSPAWHQTPATHQQSQMSLIPGQEPLEINTGLNDKCSFMEEKKHKITPISTGTEIASTRAWPAQPHNPVLYDQKAANGNAMNLFYENPNLLLGKDFLENLLMEFPLRVSKP